jgi:hypothetical protein
VSGDLEELLKRTRANVAQERGVAATLRSLSTPWRLLIAGFGILALVLLPAWVMEGPHSPRLTSVRTAALLSLGGSAAILLEGTLHPLHRRPWPITMVRALIALVVGMAAVVLTSLASRAPEPPLHEAAACFAEGLALGSASLLVVGALERDGIRSAPRAGMAALLSSAAGLAFLVLHCPQTAPLHLLLGHGTLLVAALLAYTLLASRRAVQ